MTQRAPARTQQGMVVMARAASGLPAGGAGGGWCVRTIRSEWLVGSFSITVTLVVCSMMQTECRSVEPEQSARRGNPEAQEGEQGGVKKKSPVFLQKSETLHVPSWTSVRNSPRLTLHPTCRPILQYLVETKRRNLGRSGSC